MHLGERGKGQVRGSGRNGREGAGWGTEGKVGNGRKGEDGERMGGREE